jgi:membrane peptidoglycan carboxypeptidase
VIHSPNGLSPYRESERAVRRRNLVLEMMEEQGRLDPKERARAQAEPLRLAAVTPDPGDARYFLDLLRRQLADVYDASVLETDGLRIYSTLDRRAQRLAAIALREGIADLEKSYPRSDPAAARALQGCLVALRPQTGESCSRWWGRDYATSQFDRCTRARRQTGSAFKPFAYAAALEPYRGVPAITLAKLLDDSPLEISTPSGPWRPENYDKRWHGMVTVRQAIEKSLNVATARMAQGRLAADRRPGGRRHPVAAADRASLALGSPRSRRSRSRAPTRRSRAGHPSRAAVDRGSDRCRGARWIGASCASSA